QNSRFGLFEGFTKVMSMGGMNHANVKARGPNVTANEFELRHNVPHDNVGGRHNAGFKSE
ncbi:fucosyltransferase, partial [Trifolium medium]|nr:fucosyltransferase [Trifolium medium]